MWRLHLVFGLGAAFLFCWTVGAMENYAEVHSPGSGRANAEIQPPEGTPAAQPPAGQPPAGQPPAAQPPVIPPTTPPVGAAPGAAGPSGAPAVAPPTAEAAEPVANAPETLPDPVVRRERRPSRLRPRQQQAGLTNDQEKSVKANCLWGMPKKRADANFGPTTIIARPGYVLEHSAADRIPLWVCEKVTATALKGSADRKNSAFKPDPFLKKGARAELVDYSKSGYDRGHMAPAGDFKHDQERTNESFFLSNMAPQVGPTFNRGIWERLESKVRDWARDRGQVWVITGTMFHEAAEDDPNTADGFVDVETIGPNAVAVPTHCFKIVVGQNGDGAWESVAFVFRNTRYAQPYHPEEFRQSVSWIEERTGLDFMPDVVTANPGDSGIKNRLESQTNRFWD